MFATASKNDVKAFKAKKNNKPIAHKPITTLRQVLTNIKDKEQPNERQGAVYKINCSDCRASYIGETCRNLNIRITEHKRATKKQDKTNHIAENDRLTKQNIDWDSAQFITYSTNYRQQVTLATWYTNLELNTLIWSQQ